VISTLIEAALIVILVIYLFLGSLRVVLIPARRHSPVPHRRRVSAPGDGFPSEPA
jgi:hypothetical protein